MFYHSNGQAYGKYTQTLFGFILFCFLLSLLKKSRVNDILYTHTVDISEISRI